MKLLSRGSQMAPLDLGGSIVSMLPRLLKLLLTPSERRGSLFHPFHLTVHNLKLIFTLYKLTACLFAKSPPKHTVLCMAYWVIRTPPTILTKSVLVFPSDNLLLLNTRFFIACFS